MMALGSADEMRVWMLYCRDLGYIGDEVATLARGVSGDCPHAEGPVPDSDLISDSSVFWTW